MKRRALSLNHLTHLSPLLVVGIASTLLIFGCAKKPPACSDRRVVDVVLQKYAGELAQQMTDATQLKKAIVEMPASVEEIVTRSYDDSVGRMSCEARLRIKLTPEGANELQGIRTLLSTPPLYERFLQERFGSDIASHVAVRLAHQQIAQLELSDASLNERILYSSQFTDNGKELVVNVENLRPSAFAVGYLVGASQAAAARASRPQPAARADGSQVYATNCQACHQSDGRGVKGAFPPLDGSIIVKGTSVKLVQFILEGKNAMPSWTRLSDEEVAAVSNYVRQAWSNRLDAPVTPEMVRGLRK